MQVLRHELSSSQAAAARTLAEAQQQHKDELEQVVLHAQMQANGGAAGGGVALVAAGELEDERQACRTVQRKSAPAPALSPALAALHKHPRGLMLRCGSCSHITRTISKRAVRACRRLGRAGPLRMLIRCWQLPAG